MITRGSHASKNECPKRYRWVRLIHMSHTESHCVIMSHTESRWVMLSSVVSMPPCSMVCCVKGERGGETAFIDQLVILSDWVTESPPPLTRLLKRCDVLSYNLHRMHWWSVSIKWNLCNGRSSNEITFVYKRHMKPFCLTPLCTICEMTGLVCHVMLSRFFTLKNVTNNSHITLLGNQRVQVKNCLILLLFKY